MIQSMHLFFFFWPLIHSIVPSYFL